MSLTNINILIRERWASSSHMVHITLKKKMAVIKDHHQTIVQLLILSAISLHDRLSLLHCLFLCRFFILLSGSFRVVDWNIVLAGFPLFDLSCDPCKSYESHDDCKLQFIFNPHETKEYVIQGKIFSVQEVILPWDHNVLYLFFPLKGCFDPVWILKHF